MYGLEEEEPTYTCEYDFYILIVDTNRKEVILKDNEYINLGVYVAVSDNLSDKLLFIEN